MSQQLIDLTGIDNLPAGGAKINDNFTEVYSSVIVCGAIIPYIGASSPSGWILLEDGETIGNASSGATARANADTSNLFALLWNSFADAQASVSSGRGASASADFAANKTIELPRVNGKALVGFGSGSFTTLGGEIGSETHVLTDNEIPAHSHSYEKAGNSALVSAGVDVSVPTPASSDSTSSIGGGDPHNNIQPSIILNMIIKL